MAYIRSENSGLTQRNTQKVLLEQVVETEVKPQRSFEALELAKEVWEDDSTNKTGPKTQLYGVNWTQKQNKGANKRNLNRLVKTSLLNNRKTFRQEYHSTNKLSSISDAVLGYQKRLSNHEGLTMENEFGG